MTAVILILIALTGECIFVCALLNVSGKESDKEEKMYEEFKKKIHGTG